MLWLLLSKESILIICQHFDPNYYTLFNLLIRAENKTVATRSPAVSLFLSCLNLNSNTTCRAVNLLVFGR